MAEPYLIKRLSKYPKEGGWMYTQPVKLTIVKKGNERNKSSWNRYSRKEKV
jgi:hypothetical protein